jgi:hypothetical protein
MLKHLVIFGLLLVVMTTSVLAADPPPGVALPRNEPGTTVPATTEQVNRYLSAEAVRHMDAKSDEMLAEMKTYQDDNFQAWDARMYGLMDDIKMKFVVGGLGAMMLAMGIVAYVMMNHFKRYSYETYLQNQLDSQQADPMQGGYQPVPEQMQEQNWYPQETQPTIGSEMGQEWASESTQMNQWQVQAAYDGAYKAPVETHSEYKDEWMQNNFPEHNQKPQTPVQDEYKQQEQPLEDPYDSPEWGGKQND